MSIQPNFCFTHCDNEYYLKIEQARVEKLTQVDGYFKIVN